MLLVCLPNAATVPLKHVTCGSTSHEGSATEREMAGYGWHDAHGTIETLISTQVNPIDCEEFDMLEADCRELALVLPASVEHFVGVYAALANDSLISPVIDSY